MKERLLLLRKTLNLNQEKFGSKIELSTASISALEKGMRSITDRTVKLICTEFNVNESWLRTGEGNMFNESDDLYELFGYAVNDMTDLEKEFLTKFLKLPSKERQLAIKYLRKLAEN